MVFHGSERVVVWRGPILDCAVGVGALCSCFLQLLPVSDVQCVILHCSVER
jgi:hypothetical protein